MLKITAKFKTGRLNRASAFCAEIREDGKLWSPFMNREMGVLNASRTQLTQTVAGMTTVYSVETVDA